MKYCSCFKSNIIYMIYHISEEKMLTGDGCRNMDDDCRQPKAIGHLSDSDNLKIHSTVSHSLNAWAPFYILDTFT